MSNTHKKEVMGNLAEGKAMSLFIRKNDSLCVSFQEEKKCVVFDAVPDYLNGRILDKTFIT